MTPATQTTPAEDMTTDKYYFLVAGNVVYKIPGGPANENPMGVISLNGMITTDSETLHLADIGKAQQVLQHHFRMKTEDPSLEVADVIILNIVPLGLQSEMTFKNIVAPLVM